MKFAIITGVSRGIGKATAWKFLTEGWRVIGTSTTGASALTHENLEVYQLDLSDDRNIKNFSKQEAERTERMNALINNAAVAYDSDVDDIDTDVLRKTLEVNLIGLVTLTESLLPIMADGGHIINLSSGLSSLTEEMGTWSPAYRISKAGVNMFTRHLAVVLRRRNITVSSFDPGWVRTDMGSENAPRDPSEPAEELFQLATSRVESGYFWKKGKKRTW